VALRQVFLRVLQLYPSPVITAMLHIHFYLGTIIRRTSGRALGELIQSDALLDFGDFRTKNTFTHFYHGQEVNSVRQLFIEQIILL
jgi:hypothetical protein